VWTFNAWAGRYEDTYVAANMMARSQIDHFLFSNNMTSSIKAVDVLKLYDNMSNHRPIKLDLDLVGIQAMHQI
jgi:exonuclease III